MIIWTLYIFCVCVCETEVRGLKGKIIGLKDLLDKNNMSQICR